MNNINGLHKIFASIKANSPVEDLNRITGEHPYFSVAQLYLLQQAKNDLSLFEKQSSKTALFFNNTDWLNLQLNWGDNVKLKIKPPEQNEKIVTENIIETDEEDQVFKSSINFKTEVKEDTIAFEPLHVTDYFLSQGIRLTEEPISNDKLGTQMKSFTEWLKTMKKIHSDQLISLSGQADMSNQQLAEKSNKDDTVATEAMADVLLMQGKKEKAIEVYKKLSLLNPSKTVYFAAKIDQLKEH